MTSEVSPAIVIGIGPIAKQITKRAQELIKMRNGLDRVPPIFQFLVVNETNSPAAESITQAYNAAANKRAAIATEATMAIKVFVSRVEAFIIAPLDAKYHDVTTRAAQALKECSRRTLAGGRNAIFLIPRTIDQGAAKEQLAMAEAIDAEVKTNLLFNRSFFIDEIDELGQSVEEKDLIELVARFVTLAIASQLSNSIRAVPPPYIGDGRPHQGYASFSCTKIGFDAARLRESLSIYLARDICDQLFAGCGSESETDKWSEQARSWFLESLKEPMGDPSRLEINDINQDGDFIKAKARLDEFTQGACKSLFHDAEAYGKIISDCLDAGVIQLESHAKEIKQTKKKINDLEIKILLGESRGESGKVTSRTVERPWRLALLLTTLGISILLTVMVITSGQMAQQKVFTSVGVILLIAAIVIVAIGRTKETTDIITTTIPYLKELNDQKALYRRQKKAQSIHLALFTYLDLGYANLANLRQKTFEQEITSAPSVFDVDLIDEELTRTFYETQYESKDADIKAFTSELQIEGIHQVMFSRLSKKLSDHLREYCNHCFDKVRKFDLEKVFRLRESMNGHRPLLPVSSPLWHPLNSDSDKVTLALTGDRNRGLRTLLTNAFGANNLHFFDSEDSTNTTLVQIAYGQEMKNILTDLFSQAGKS